MPANTFTHPFTVPKEMVDKLGHVHYLSYQVMAKMAHDAFLAEHNLQIEEVTKDGSALFMREVHCLYRLPVKEGDDVQIELVCRPEGICNIVFNVVIKLGNKVAVEISYQMVVVHFPSGKPKKLGDSPFNVLFKTE